MHNYLHFFILFSGCSHKSVKTASRYRRTVRETQRAAECVDGLTVAAHDKFIAMPGLSDSQGVG